MGLFTGTSELEIHKIIQERDDKITKDIATLVNREECKLDTLIQGVVDLDKGFCTLSATVSTNHHSALLKMENVKNQVNTEIAERYATKVELSNGLNALRTTAKVIWTVVIAVAVVAVWLSDKGIL